VSEHYNQLREEALLDLENLKSEKAELILVILELTETLKGLKDRYMAEKKEHNHRVKEQQGQLSEGLKRME
jgi:hypothetical protein